MTAGVQKWEHKLFDKTAEQFAFSIKKILEKLFSSRRELQNCASHACFNSGYWAG